MRVLLLCFSSLLVACAEPAPGDAREALSAGGLYYLVYTPTPDPIPLNEHFTLVIDVYDGADRTAPADVSLSVDADMPAHNHGMNTEPSTDPLGDGAFFVEGLLFHMAGEWEISVALDGAAGSDSAAFPVECCEG